MSKEVKLESWMGDRTKEDIAREFAHIETDPRVQINIPNEAYQRKPSSPVVSPETYSLTSKLLATYPELTFVLESVYYGDIRRIVVYKETEPIGALCSTAYVAEKFKSGTTKVISRELKVSYEVSPTVGRSATMYKEDNVVKRVGTWQMQSVGVVVKRAITGTHYEFHECIAATRSAFADLIIQNRREILALLLESHPISSAVAQKMQELSTTISMHELLISQGVVVVTYKDGFLYTLYSNQSDICYAHSFEELPTHLRTKIKMLHLVLDKKNQGAMCGDIGWYCSGGASRFNNAIYILNPNRIPLWEFY